ncbi:MAG: DNA-3-methyladenine glycosylase [Holophagales bacterium]|nr:DNA-3-methyladenine glycosylase [Holophagales bacterium]MYH24165.1 DNA-3-methyladenine glycosylase [Holophagales bacterium]
MSTGRSRLSPLPRSFYTPTALDVAPTLLNKVLVRGHRAARIVEVEAYEGANDPSSHGHRGMTNRTRTMFGPPGHLYVYFTYGMHHCANVVCGEDGVCSAVLLRAAAPLAGDGIMRRARNAASRRRSTEPFRVVDLCSGPARLCQAFGFDRRDDGADLANASTRPGHRPPIFIADDGVPPPERPGRSGRIGVTRAPNRLWRFWVAGEPNVS